MTVGLVEGMGKVRNSLCALHFHLICLLIVMMVHEQLNLGQVLRFCSVVVVSDLLGKILVFAHLLCVFCLHRREKLT